LAVLHIHIVSVSFFERWHLKTKIMSKNKKRRIDKVTTDRLDIALRMVGIQLNIELVDRIIDIVELIEDKGGNTSLKDVSKLQAEWGV
jgi:hypothetical protein